jgi:hypothetical protein
MQRDTSMEYSLYQLASGAAASPEATSNAISTLAELARRGNKRALEYLEKLAQGDAKAPNLVKKAVEELKAATS